MRLTLITLAVSAFIAFTAVPASAQSGGLQHSYNYLDVGYERTSFKGALGDALDDGNGVATDFVLSPVDNFLLTTEYHYAKPDTFRGDSISFHDLKLGLGGYVPFGGALSFYTHLGGRYLKADPDFADLGFSDWGFYVEPGLRLSVGELLEFYGAADYSNVGSTSVWGAEAGGVVNFNDTFGLEVFGRFFDDFNAYGLGLRIGW